MSLAKFELNNVRNIKYATLTPSPRMNLISGENASGKSALLEAIFLLGRGNSFRTRHLNQMINFDADTLMISGQSVQKGGHRVQLGIEINRQKKKLKFPVMWLKTDRIWLMHYRSNGSIRQAIRF